MLSSGTEIILRSTAELDEPIRVHGASPSAQALLVGRLVVAGGSHTPWIVLCPDEDQASDFASNLESIASIADDRQMAALHFPSWDQSAYSPIAPSIRTRLRRMAVLARLNQATSGTPLVIVTTLAAACQATVPPALLEANTIRLKIDESVSSRERLAFRFTESGYSRVDTVEDPGTFGVRGDIVDVYPPDSTRPIRVELFGDVVEKMRYFDPGSQRTSTEGRDSLRELAIPPAREVLIQSATAASLRERVKARADDLGVSRAVRDPVLSAIQNLAYPEHCDAWAPFAYEKSSTLFDHIPPGTRAAWVDELGCQQEWDRFVQQQITLESDAPHAGLILPRVGELFAWGKIEKGIRDFSRLYLDRVQLADLASVESDTASEPDQEKTGPEQKVSASHRVFVRGNADLAQGSKQSLGELEPKFRLWLKQGFRVLAVASTRSQLERIRFLLEDRNLPCATSGPSQPSLISLREGVLTEGFRWPSEGLVVITESEILGTRARKKNTREKSSTGSAAKDWSGLQALSDLSPGDAVVHVDHGIGRYQGLVRLDLLGAPSDFLLIEYANKDKLYLPVYRLNVIQKYVGSGESAALDRLGSHHFAKAKEKVREAVKKLAIDLVGLYAQRKIRPGIRFSPRDAAFREFEAKFPFDETPDQLRAIDDVFRDMEAGKVMDRLVCGDVGYGKTEVAIRAAFRAVSDGKQVVVLVPTTVLAFQHEQSFRSRLKDYPITIESVSRFKSTKEQRGVLEGVRAGKVDIIIGTHRLLSRDVAFRDLGLVIVDEEHRFGVEHKEKLKTLKVNTHVLTLTATPIPRTLHMALSGLRDISLINTAPVDRLPIRTYVSRYDEALIERAIRFELGRGGQVFVLHNRVDSIHQLANRIRELVPEASVSIGHGQMGEGELEKTMLRFYERASNVLVCTTIIESGLDVPSANTIVVNRADMLGLAQLYQIRGRVGRGQQRAYAYLLIPAEGAVTDDAKRRLEVIQKFVELGSGFSIASHDLEIRGGGDLLGAQQSGHIAAVGFDLYTELLEEAIHQLQGKPELPEHNRSEPEIKAPFPAFLSEQYVPDIHQRLSLYRRFSAAADETEIDRLEEELRDRFGALPLEAQNLLWLIRIKLLLMRAGVDSLTVGKDKVSFVPGQNSRLDPTRAIALVAAHPGKYQILPDSKVVTQVPTGSLRDLFFAVESLLRDFGASQQTP